MEKIQATLKIECKDPDIIRKSLLSDIESKKDLKVKLKTDKSSLIIQIKKDKLFKSGH